MLSVSQEEEFQRLLKEGLRPPHTRAGRLASAAIGPLATAGLLVLSFHPMNLGWTVWVAFIPLITWLLYPSRSGRAAFGGAWLAGMVYYVGISLCFLSLDWWGWGALDAQNALWFQLRQRLFIGGVVLALSLWGSLFWGVWAWLIRRHARTPWAMVLLAPSLWVLLVEYLPYQAVSGMSWGQLGYRLHDALLIRQTASLAGMHGLGFLILLVNAGLGAWWLAARGVAPTSVIHQAGWRRIAAHARCALSAPGLGSALVTCSVVLAASVVYGFLSVRFVDQQPNPALSVAVLQGNQLTYQPEDFSLDHIDRVHGTMIDQALAVPTDVVVLPETVWMKTLRLDESRNPWVAESLMVSRDALGSTMARKLAQSDGAIIHGIDTMRAGQVYNAIAFWNAQELLGVYFKRRLVPFSEFRPKRLGWLSPQNQLHGTGFEYSPGQTLGLVRVREIPIGSAICHEVMFPQLLRQSVLGGAQLLINAGNDGIFKSPVVAQELMVMAKLRAVESRRYMLRSMKTGISAIIDPWGRVVAQVPVNAQALIRGEVQPIGALSVYDRWGEWVLWMAGCLALIGLLAGKRRDASWRG
jgi:apolipoprotein N-acyltransferase